MVDGRLLPNALGLNP